MARRSYRIDALLVAGILLVLSSCSSDDSYGSAESMEYFNSQSGCQIGDTCYMNFAGMDIQVWNPGWEEMRVGLCCDPLCSHDSTDSLCPSAANLWAKTVVTDGTRLYMNVLNPALTDENGTMYRQIFSMNRDGSAFTLLHTYDATGNSSPYMQYADGYLYFQQGFYNENYDPMAEYTASAVQSAHIMRISVDGGKTETVLSEELDIGSSFFVDAEQYYLFSPGFTNMTRLDVIDPDTKAVTENVLPAANGELYEITVYAGKTWLSTLDGDLYVLSDDGFALVCEDKGRYTFGGGIWYTEEAEPLYLGAKEMPTGAPGGETAQRAYYVTATTALCRIDPLDHNITEYALGADFDPEDTIIIACATDSGILADVSNGRAAFASDAEGYSCLVGIADGKLTQEKIYE
ncbi:MAG: hypothetical protein IJ449_10885 [Clostridia bacterium]|nr:hypothetical protein [Clostridia bacterium]